MAIKNISTRRTALPDALAALVRLHIARLRANGIDEPLAESFTLAAVVADLFMLASATVSADVAVFVGEDML